MRDPARIQKFCNRLAKAWRQHPDWRFGQLIVNVFGKMEADPFFPEDEEMIQFIEKCLIPSNAVNEKSKNSPEVTTKSDKEKE